MFRQVGSIVAACAGLLLLGSVAPPEVEQLASAAVVNEGGAEADKTDSPDTPAPLATPTPTPPKPPTVEQALAGGVLIVVSIPAQRAFVFKDGQEWGSAVVSTGRRGHDTPVGVFPILQKSVAHRSTLYNDAPMPYMQRLTWGGVALHGGNVSRYRASHGCIRLPHAFARKLFAITSYRSTAVLVTRSRATSPATALALAGGRSPTVAQPRVELAADDAAPRVEGPVQTIQLAAAPSPQNAAMLWDQLVERRPQLAQLQHQIIPATVNSLHVYRLRASGPGAAAICRRAASEGMDCFRVST